MSLRIDILYTSDCTDWPTAAELVTQVLNDLGLAAEVSSYLVKSDRQAIELNFIGSPTILVNGVDPWPIPGAPAGLRLRPYFTEQGMLGHPTYAMLYDVLQAYAS